MRIQAMVLIVVLCLAGTYAAEAKKKPEEKRAPASRVQCDACLKCKEKAMERRKTVQCPECDTFHVHVSARTVQAPLGAVRTKEQAVETACRACAESLAEKGSACDTHSRSQEDAARLFKDALGGMGGQQAPQGPGKKKGKGSD